MKDCFRLLVFSLGLAVAGQARAAVPAWLKVASEAPVTVAIDGAPAVVLADDSVLEVDSAGVLTVTRRFAVRILHDAGRENARGDVFYNGASSKVESLRAWLVRNGKELEGRGTNEWIDLAAESTGAVVDETRRRTINLAGRALKDDIFACETKIQVPLTVGQTMAEFGGLLPMQRQSYTLVLPPSFDLEVTSVGAAAVQEAHDDPRRWSWTLTGTAYRPEEPNDAGSGRIDLRLLFQIVPRGADVAKFKPDRFRSWNEVAAFTDRLNQPQCDTNAALQARARALADGSPDRLTTIRRIGAHVQSLRYIAFNQGLRYGYGWRARKATEVFATGYGDCKDKANLMVALLREMKIPAYMVIARTDRDRPVRSDLPSPIQFNHAIVAIPVGPEIKLPAVQAVPGLGACLFFDPTNPFTFVGDLSGNLQGSSVFVLAPGVNGLVELPAFSPEQGFRIERAVEMALAPNGAIILSGTIAGSGQPGAVMRATFREAHQPAEIDKLLLRQLGPRMRSAMVTERKVTDITGADRMELSFVCGLGGYMQLTASANPVVQLDVLSRDFIPNLTETRRRLPVELLPYNVVDSLKLALPDGYEVAEVPAEVAVQSEYGSLTINYEAAPGAVRMTRNLVLPRLVVPVADYPKLKKFLGDLARVDRSSVLLQRRPAAAAGTGR